MGQLWEQFKERTGKGEQPKNVLDALGLDRYCCRALFLTHRDIHRDISKFSV